MKSKEGISDLLGVMVVSQKEGANLGQISKLFVDADTRTICALSYRRSMGQKESFLLRKEITLIGRDVVLATTEAAAEPLTKSNAPGKSIKELQGMWVTTHDGQNLGTLVDIDVDEKSWTISELRLADGTVLAIEPKKIIIGRDQIVVPPAYADRLKKPKRDNKEGFLGRLFGAESIEDLARTMRRMLKPPKAAEPKGGAGGAVKTASVKNAAKDDKPAAKPMAKTKPAKKNGKAAGADA